MKLQLSYKGNYRKVGIMLGETEIDDECRDLCDALNSLPGIKTTYSCSGHGREPFQVWFTATDFRGLNFIARSLDPRHWEYGKNWSVVLANTDVAEDLKGGQVFLLESVSIDVGELKIQVESLINATNLLLNDEVYIKSFLGSYDGFVAFRPINGKCYFAKELKCPYFHIEEWWGGDKTVGYCALDYSLERTGEQVLKVASNQCQIETLTVEEIESKIETRKLLDYRYQNEVVL